MGLLSNIGKAIGEGLQSVGSTTARAAAQANEESRQAQSAQGAFNQESANLANSITDNRINAQYGFNSAMMSNANEYNTGMWQTAANWNEEMWERQAEFNRKEAEKQRAWQEQMANTQYQRAVKDMSKAGLNPILAVTNGGVGTSVPGGATASVGGASMSSASSAMASGGLIGAESASMSNYMGQMEYMSGVLGLISAVVGGLSTATEAMGGLGDAGEAIGDAIGDMFNSTKADPIGNWLADKWWDWFEKDDYYKNKNSNKQKPIVVDKTGLSKKK